MVSWHRTDSRGTTTIYIKRIGDAVQIDIQTGTSEEITQHNQIQIPESVFIEMLHAQGYGNESVA